MKSLTVRERMDMVQRGYLPTSPEDVERYFSKQPPTGTSQELIKNEEYSFNSMGEHKLKPLDQAFRADPTLVNMARESGINIDEVERNFFNPTGDGTEDNLYDENDYQGSVLNQSKQITPSQQREFAFKERLTSVNKPDLNKTLISTIKKTTVQESTVPKLESSEMCRRGEKAGIRYLNAFLQLLKTPSVDSRRNFLVQLQEMLEIEGKLNDKDKREFQKGLAISENKMFKNLTKR